MAGKITTDELKGIFGENIPMEAAAVIIDAPKKGMSADDVRVELNRIADGLVSDLAALRQAAKEAEANFDQAAASIGGRWVAYKRWDAGEEVPFAIHQAERAYVEALHAYYSARDGDRGFLGSRGL